MTVRTRLAHLLWRKLFAPRAAVVAASVPVPVALPAEWTTPRTGGVQWPRPAYSS